MSVHYIASNSYFYANGVQIYQFKMKHFEIKPYSLSLGNISEDFMVDNMKKLDWMERCSIFLLIMRLLILILDLWDYELEIL